MAIARMIITLASSKQSRALPGNQVKADELSTTLATTSVSGIMARLMVGVSVGAGIRTEALSISEYGR